METWLLRTTEFDGAHWQHSNSSIADPVLFSAGGTDGCAVRSRFVECSSRRGPRPRAILTPSVFFGRFLPALGRIQRKESFFGTPASRGLMGRYPYYYGLLSPPSKSGPRCAARNRWNTGAICGSAEPHVCDFAAVLGGRCSPFISLGNP